jgi:tRNA(Ile2) C34 agmatinyltransferase TiaS
MTRAGVQRESFMAETLSTPTCPKCRKPMHFIVLNTGGRKFQCVQCDRVDPMRLSDIQALIKGELQPPKLL